MTDLTELEALIARNESKQIYVSPAVKELIAELDETRRWLEAACAAENLNALELTNERERFASYRAFVHHTLTREADLASGLGLLTPPERLRDLAELLEKA